MFCEIAEGTVTNRNVIIPVGRLPFHIERAQRTSAELYRSMYDYDDEINQHMTVRQTVKNYRGSYYLPKIIFDVDKGDNTDTQTLMKASQLIDALHERWQIPARDIMVYFSGRGYHIAIPDVFHFQPSNQLPNNVARTLAKHFGSFGIDDIYSNATRLIRVAGTVNAKSGLFKVRLTFGDLGLGFEHIREIAQSPRVFEQPPADSTEEHSELPDHSGLVESAPVTLGIATSSPAATATGALTSYVTCMQHLFKRGEKQGSRHNDILRLASAFRRGGIPEDAVVSLLTGWASSLEPYAVKAAVRDVFKGPLQYGCEDHIMRAHCDPACIFAKHKNFIMRMKSTEEIEAEFVEYVNSDAFRNELNLQEFFRLNEPFYCRKGDVVVFLGDTGIGKSALIQHICVENPQMKILYLSLEMGQHLTFRRLVQAKHGLTKEQVFAHYRENKNTLGTAIGHITVTTTSPRMDALARIIAETTPDVVVIDTLDCIEEKGDMNGKIDEIVLGLLALAERYKCIILPIHHISKFAAAEKELTVHSGRGSATLEHKASMVIGIEKMSNEYRRVYTLKSRDEIPFNVVCRFEYDTFRYLRMDDDYERLTWIT